MKRKIIAILIFLLAICAVPQKAEAASNKTMKKAYTKYLKNTVSGKKYYAIANIGEGNKPALLVAKGDNTYSYDIENGSKNYYCACDVYYYVKGKVKKIGTFEGGRAVQLAKKGKQYYLKSGLSDAAFFAYVKNDKLYTYEFYREWDYSRLKVGNKKVKDYGYLTPSQYIKKRDSFKVVKTVKFEKNSYGYVAPNLEKKENSHTYKKCTYFTGYMVDDAYPNVYKQSKKTKRIIMVQYDAHIIDIKGKYLLTASNHGDYIPETVYVINMATGKVKRISRDVIANIFPKIYGTNLYYPEYVNSNDYNKKEFEVVVKRYVLSTGKKKTLTKKIKCNEVISFSNKYIRYKKGSAEYMYYYSNGKVKKLGQKNNNTTNNNNSNNTTNNTVTVQPSIRISGGYTGSGSCTFSTTTVPGNLSVSWSSSNPSVASVSGGKVTAKAAGTAKITASITYGGKTYSASKNITVGAKKSYGAWSGWTIDPIAATAGREVRTTALYRYYYFYCPVCGGREPLQGISDCHRYTLTLSNGNVGWFPVPYSQCASAPYSYASYKRYTTSLGDGRIWNFSTGNLYHTAIGTKDSDSAAEVIKTGYSYRNVTTSYYISGIN